ncbi:MAG: AMP-binding protein [Odoribacter sp.]
MEESFLYYIEHSIKIHWHHQALSDYKSTTHTYKDVAQQIAAIHLLLETGGIRKGDRIALCSRNMSNWGIAFLATLSYGAVAIPILHEFKADNIHHIINHSEARLLFVGTSIWEELDKNNMSRLETVIRMEDFTLFHNTNLAFGEAHTHWKTLFKQKYPEPFTEKEVHYRRDQPEELAMINYTSGTTKASKGVMLPYRSIWSNLKYALDKMGYNPGERLVSILTMAHMYGLAFELIYPFASGTHVYFISKTPSPKVIQEIFNEVRPNLIVAVPLIIEKIIKHRVLPQLEKFHIKLFMKIPYINRKLRAAIRNKIIRAFGGRFKLIAIGGAALNFEVEKFLTSVKFPYTVGYGMTECGPAISYDDWHTFKPGSCGKAVDRMEIKIDSPDSEEIVGEILVKGTNVMNGYYKNPEATATAMDANGWLHTGDLGIIDPEGYLYIKGRSKNMILGASGQNIYPEEIEDRLNALPYISESLIVEHDGKLTAIVYPDYEQAKKDKISAEGLKKIMDENRKSANQILPTYSQIARLKIRETEFEKTPKRSIKRYLYQ